MNSPTQKCLIIGAGGGIGRALSQKLHEQGWSLVLAGRNADALDPVVEMTGGVAEVCDAADFDAVTDLFSRHEGINAAVNLAGSIMLKPAHLTSSDDFSETIDLNLRSAFSLVRASAQAMRKTGGSIVLMSSCAASVGLANHEAIAAAKAGVEGLTRAAAASYAHSGIRINAIAPGLVDTPLASRITQNENALKASTAMHPLARIGQPEEIANAIAYMLNPESAWITGQVLGVDGGLARVRPR